MIETRRSNLVVVRRDDEKSDAVICKKKFKVKFIDKFERDNEVK